MSKIEEIETLTGFRISSECSCNLPRQHMTEPLLQKIESHVVTCFREHSRDYLLYHNLAHTREVVIRAMEIAETYPLEEEDRFCLIIAAWFHDLGHLYTTPENHEKAGTLLMREFLNNHLSESKLVIIENLILATRFPTPPRTFLESILCDADMYHLGTSRFFMTDALVKQELELRTGQVFNDWDRRTLYLLNKHEFYTEYCKNKLNEGKNRNIEILKEKIKK